MIVAVRGNIVRVGIEAPPEVRIVRGELLPPATESNGGLPASHIEKAE